jgi:hypothetical protein
MERSRISIGKQFDLEFARVLFHWQGDSDSPDLTGRMDSLLKKASDAGVGIEIRIKDEVLKNTEGRRAISMADLARFATHDENSYVFRFSPKKSPEGKIRIGAKDVWMREGDRGIVDKFNFVIEAKSDFGWRTVAIFRPHEITSIKIR